MDAASALKVPGANGNRPLISTLSDHHLVETGGGSLDYWADTMVPNFHMASLAKALPPWLPSNHLDASEAHPFKVEARLGE